MVTHEEARALALSLPEAEERETWGHPTFRVNGKIFASLWEDDISLGLKISKDEREELVTAEPDKFFFTPGTPN